MEKENVQELSYYGTPLYPLLVYCNDPLDDQTTLQKAKGYPVKWKMGKWDFVRFAMSQSKGGDLNEMEKEEREETNLKNDEFVNTVKLA